MTTKPRRRRPTAGHFVTAVSLQGGGLVTLKATCNLFELTSADRVLLEGLTDQLTAYRTITRERGEDEHQLLDARAHFGDGATAAAEAGALPQASES